MGVQHLDTLVVSEDLQRSVCRLVDRLGPVRIEYGQQWQHVVHQLEVGFTNNSPAALGPDATVVVVGSPADVLKHARRSANDFGFVMPIAQIAKPWQRARSWRDDATLELWHTGWSPLNVDRVRVPTRDATIEFAIGDARPVPAVQVSATSLVSSR